MSDARPTSAPTSTAASSVAAEEPPGSSHRRRLATLLRWLGVALWVVDAGSLGLLLAGLGAPWWLAIPLGVGVGGATTYQAQWRFLLSRDAYARSRSLSRHAWMAAFVLAVNLGGGYLVTQGLFYTYLAMRVLTAVFVVRALGTDWRVERRAPGSVRASRSS